MEDIKIKFGKKIKKLRQDRNLSQEALANLCELDRTYLPGIEKGHRNVSLLVIEKIARGLKVEIKELFE
jgi:transcriptional regulator with XRE-family HTH domain